MKNIEMKRYDVKYFLIVLIILVSMVFQCLPFFLTQKFDVENIIKLSVVELKAETEDIGESFGTAVFVSNDGTLVTNSHVVTYRDLGEYYAFDKFSIRFSYENDYHEVKLIKYDIEKDLAVLKLEDLNCKFTPLKLGNSDRVNFNDKVYAIGNLNNVGISLTTGVISNPKINVTYNDISREVIQCDLTIAEGNSGGALINDKGELIGITTFRLKDNSLSVIYGICYCIPMNVVVEYIK